jgi:hypothetical protein
MDPLSQRMLENILTAQVLTLAGEMQRQSGKPVPDLSGHDYVKDAVREIKQKREGLIQMLLDD